LKANDYFAKIYGFDKKIIEFVSDAESMLSEEFESVHSVREANQLKVIKAFQDECVSTRHFNPTTGYGYGDDGRDKLSSLFARVFGAESAIASPLIVSGTHAITLCLFGLLRPLDAFVSITGRPYDTLSEAVGLNGGNNTGSLKDFAVKYYQIDLLESGGIDYFKLLNYLNLDDKIKLVYIQRSRGYEWRNSLTIADIKEAVKRIKKTRPDVAVLVDNCYGEFCEELEPTQVGADIVVGSLIKNPGGGLAPTGAYIAGKAGLVELIAGRLTSPGIGREVGSYMAGYLPFYQGLYLAPFVTSEALKGSVLAAKVFQDLGFEVMPRSNDERSDITQSIRFEDEKKLLTFIKSIQKAAAVDSHVEPVPWDMPGYENPVIMAAGTFIQGSSIELSADAPVKPPYIAYIQGGLTYIHCKLGIMTALQQMKLL
jgi:cystathionine beta-lyase family protein involved in aluminum resistance